MRRRWVFVTLVTGVLTLGMLGGTVLAQETDADGGKRFGLLGRVAEILGIGGQELTDAFDQAKTEIRDEREGDFVDGLVEDGRLTEEGAADLREWFDSRPEGFEGVRDGFRFGPGFGRGFGKHGPGHHDLRGFTFRFGGDIEDLPDIEGLFPNLDQLQARIDQFNERFGEDGSARRFEGRGFRFYFGPIPHARDDEENPADNEPAAEGVSL